MPKNVLNVILILLTIALVGYSVYLAMNGQRDLASYLLIWALVVHTIVRSYLA